MLAVVLDKSTEHRWEFLEAVWRGERGGVHDVGRISEM